MNTLYRLALLPIVLVIEAVVVVVFVGALMHAVFCWTFKGD